MILSYGGSIHIGDRVSVNPFTIIYGIGDVHIGNGVRIATSVTIIPGNHIQGTDEIPLTKTGITKIGIRIEDNVWIGAGAIILDGVTVGRNAIIGAGSVVTRDVAPNAKVAGVPARPLVSSAVPYK
jgi:acetyltransferase-like isoleucine patch superfamily enzyme